MMILALLVSLAAQDPTPMPAAKAKSERKICKDLESTGSRLGGARECHTAAQWKALQNQLDGRDINALNNIKGLNAGQTAP